MGTSGALISESISAITNVLLLSIVPSVWYLVRERTLRGFLRSLGIYKPQVANPSTTFLLMATVYLITLTANIAVIASGHSERSAVDTQGLTAFTLFLYLLLYGLKTGIAEEILFRGFFAKRLIGALGFAKGNVVQAVVFALPHVVISGSASPVDIAVRITNAFLLGYIFGYVMDRRCDGSIVPVMGAHVLFNMMSSFVLLAIL